VLLLAVMGTENARSLRDFSRAAGGGLIVGLPLLYTMEVWAQGAALPWWKLLLLLGVAYVVVVGYNVSAGFRRERTYAQVAIDSVATMGIGLALAAVALLVLGRIDAASSLRDAVGKVALEAIPIAFGASVASAQLGGSDEGRNGRSRTGPFGRLFVGAGGALLFALNVAPTDEIPILAVDASPGLLLAVVAATLGLTLMLVFYADFGGKPAARGTGVLDHPWSETITSYAVSLGVALLLLWSFGRTDGASPDAVLSMTVVLAVVASVGAAVARLLVGRPADEGGAT
jgi:putative integral membrane protein (TIGR02587 family)